jgi:hypothetical protein
MPTPDLDHALRTVTRRKAQLRRTLSSVERNAVDAIVALESGRLPSSGGILGIGPLGSQDPFQVTVEYQQLRAAVEAAEVLGATAEQVEAALEEDRD